MQSDTELEGLDADSLVTEQNQGTKLPRKMLHRIYRACGR